MSSYFSGRGAGHVLPLFLACALVGCASRKELSPALNNQEAERTTAETLAPGVMHRAIPTGSEAGIDLIDVDLTHSSAKISVITDGLRSTSGRTFGLAHTPAEWQGKTKALAVVNGGYFGELDAAGRTEIMGLLVQNNKVRHSATVPHAALVIGSNGLPQIAWASTRMGAGFAAVMSAVGCGPMLVWNGKVDVTDRQERLVSPGARARTFVATDSTNRHFVMGIASAAEYQALAVFLVHYFPHYDQAHAGRALCLDGGSSSQLTYKLPDGTLCSPRMTGATVPDAVAIMPH